ncbi:MAG: hypothetical protein FJ222_10555 [Lentisphaerae bacterium]|nr:hypothetical protein [Lentisphaerota bacterium]
MAYSPFMYLFFLLGLSAPSAERMPSDPVKSRANYETIVAHLDTGGDLMVAANTDGVVENLVTGLRGWTEMMPQGVMNDDARQAFDRLPAFITSSGFYAVDGFGMSLLPGGDGMNTLKAFLRRDPAAAELPFWRSMVGGAPRALASLDYLPADTVLARIGSGEPGQLFKLVTDAIRQVGGADAARGLDQALAEAGSNLGTNVSALVNSLGAESFLAIQLSATQTLPVPLPNNREAAAAEPLTIPLPSLLMGAAVRDATLFDTVRRLLERSQAPCVTTQVAGATLISVTIPEAKDYPLNPTFAVHKGMFLVGSTLDAVKSAIASADSKNGLRAAPVFKKEFASLPAMNNGLSFMDPRFSETLSKVSTALMRSVSGGRSGLGGMGVFELASGSHLLVIVNEKDGIAVSGSTSASALQTLRSMTLMPLITTMGSAIAIPNLMRARAVTRNYSCINNLRMLDSAKEQWALEADKPVGAEVVEKEVLQYIKGATLPVCPQGGRYTLGPIGQPPVCSYPGHQLPQ